MASPTDTTPQASPFHGTSPFSDFLRAYDWAPTVLGHPDGWSSALRHSVALILESQFPMLLAWGEQLGLAYNAAYAEMLGERHPRAMGQSLPLVWPEHWATGAPVFARALAGEPTFKVDLPRTVTINGVARERAFTLSYSPLREDDGSVAGVLCVINETTDRVRAEAALLQADRRKDQFLALLAHELRNPLAPIGAAAELLKLAPGDPERVRATGTMIARQVGHMTTLVDDLLDVSRVTSGLVALDMGEVDMKQVVADAIEQVRPLMAARRHLCDVRIAGESAWVAGDYQRLVQVLANVCNNAAKFTPPGGRIEVLLEACDDTVRVRVQDNGVGVAPALLPQVFDLFAQAERSTDRTQGGLGLGLALVKSLVELHGGTVSMHSDGTGSGSTLTIRLPRLARGEAEADSGDGGAQAAKGEALRLLVVDDNVDGALMLAMYLEASGHEVGVEHSAQAALARAAAGGYDAFLLDIGLPGMDGKELARRLRAMPQAEDAMLIAITGYGQQGDGAGALGAGFDHYMVKPVDPSAVVALLAGMVRMA